MVAPLICSEKGAGTPTGRLEKGVTGGNGRLTISLVGTMVALTLFYHLEFVPMVEPSAQVAGLVAMSVVLVLSFLEVLKEHVEYVKILLACFGFMIVGPALITLNKHVMEDCSFEYPLTLSGLGLLTSAIFAQVLVSLGLAELRPTTTEAVRGCNFVKVVMPIAIARALAISFGNAVYLHLSLGFIQMLKALTPAMVLVFMGLAGVEMPMRPSIACVIIIVAGTVVEVNGELQATALGLGMMAMSSASEAFCVVMNQKMLQGLSFTEVEAMYLIAGSSTLVLAVPAAALEWSHLVANERYMVFCEHPWKMLGVCSLGLAVNYLTMYVIKLTSSMTVKVLNTFRCIALVAVGVLLYGERRSTRQLCGYAVSLVGFVGYNYFQLKREHSKALEDWMDAKLASCAKRSGWKPNPSNFLSISPRVS